MDGKDRETVKRYFKSCQKLLSFQSDDDQEPEAVIDTDSLSLKDPKAGLLNLCLQYAKIQQKVKNLPGISKRPDHDDVQIAVDKSQVNLHNDLIAGDFNEPFYYTHTFLYPIISCITSSSLEFKPNAQEDTPLDILEVIPANTNKNHPHHVMSQTLLNFWREIFLFDTIKLNLSILHPDPQSIDPSLTTGLQLIESPDLSLNSIKSQNMILYKWDDETAPQILQSAFKNLAEGGYLLVTAKDRIKCPQVLEMYRKLGIQDENHKSSAEIIEEAERIGFITTNVQILHKLLPLKGILFRKRKQDLSSIMHRVIEIGVNDAERWFEDLKLFLREPNDERDKRIWLVAKNEGVKYTGISGLIASLRLEEGGERLRSIIDFTADHIDINDPKYAEIIKMDMVHNVFDIETKRWGFYQPTFSNADLPDKTCTEYSYLRSLKQGDMSSLTWVESELKTIYDANNNMMKKGKVVKVNYSALNFRDIMFASGQLDSEAIPGIHPNVAQDSILGLEFAGVDSDDGKRVMGITPYKGLATRVFVEDEEVDFTWPIPENWTLEDAATVPVVYATAFYSLILRGHLAKGESVLIHSGCGGVGLAAIRICLSYGCQVFTTVGSDEKRKYLMDHFPQLTSRHIFNSRDLTFEESVLKETNGEGVDVILNSLSEEKLQASLRCLAQNGRFLEIGKVDFIRNHPLFAHQFDDNRSFHGVLLDALFKYSDHQNLPIKMLQEKKRLKDLVSKGIAEGVVKPLDRTVFDFNRVEDAFRFMASGKHIGKVLIRIQGENNRQVSDHPIPSLRATYFYPDKSYLVLGGLGGFGLELVQWMVQKGARNITISSRRGIRDSYQKYCLVRMKQKGVKVTLTQADVSKESGCREALEECMSSGPVGGIFNVAVVYKDTLFQDQSISQFKEVCAPKAEATRHLDKLSQELCPELDYFLTFSSLSANRGNAGQTNYNYANSMMDSICNERARRGLPALFNPVGCRGRCGNCSRLIQLE